MYFSVASSQHMKKILIKIQKFLLLHFQGDLAWLVISHVTLMFYITAFAMNVKIKCKMEDHHEFTMVVLYTVLQFQQKMAKILEIISGRSPGIYSCYSHILCYTSSSKYENNMRSFGSGVLYTRVGNLRVHPRFHPTGVG